jgi:hypothetical protein
VCERLNALLKIVNAWIDTSLANAPGSEVPEFAISAKGKFPAILEVVSSSGFSVPSLVHQSPIHDDILDVVLLDRSSWKSVQLVSSRS